MMKGIDLKRATKETAKSDDWFTLLLLRLILKSDEPNKKLLSLGYPVEVAACVIFKSDERCPYLDDEKTRVDYDLIVKMAEHDALGNGEPFDDFILSRGPGTEAEKL